MCKMTKVAGSEEPVWLCFGAPGISGVKKYLSDQTATGIPPVTRKGEWGRVWVDYHAEMGLIFVAHSAANLLGPLTQNHPVLFSSSSTCCLSVAPPVHLTGRPFSMDGSER